MVCVITKTWLESVERTVGNDHGASVSVVVLKVHRLELEDVDRMIGDGLVRNMLQRRLTCCVDSAQ